MRPLTGVVIKDLGRTLEIKLESGLVIETRKSKNLRLYDPVLVNYDFTRMSVVSVYKESDYDAGELDSSEEVRIPNEEKLGIIEDHFRLGALNPVFEGLVGGSDWAEFASWDDDDELSHQ